MRKISRYLHLKKQQVRLEKNLSGENDKFFWKTNPSLFEEGRLRFENRVTKVQNLHACFVSWGVNHNFQRSTSS
jgi:hypothetical protein